LWAGGRILRGRSLTEQGQMDEGIREMQEGLTAWQATGALSHRPSQLALLAEALGKEGHVQEGLTALAEAQTLVLTTQERFSEAELYRLQGELLLRQAQPAEAMCDQAEACFRRALAVAHAQGAKSLHLRAVMSLSRLYRRQGRAAEGRPILAETYGSFTEGFDTLDLQEAGALLQSLG
jgi:predicted ATPase